MAWRMWVGGLTGLMVALVVATVVNSHGLIGDLVVGGFTIAGLVVGGLWEDRVLIARWIRNTSAAQGFGDS